LSRGHCDRIKIATQFGALFVTCDFTPDWGLDGVRISHARKDRTSDVAAFIELFSNAATKQATAPGDRLIRYVGKKYRCAYRLVFSHDKYGHHRGLGYATKSPNLHPTKDLGMLLTQLCGAVTELLRAD
jgi:hypothetical protein